jgi:hypothetical protein
MYRVSIGTVGRGGMAVPRTILDPDLRQLYPYLGGAIVAYTAGMMTLTLNSLATTYTILALASVFTEMARTRPEQPPQRFRLSMPLEFLALSVLFLGIMFVFIRLAFRV